MESLAEEMVEQNLRRAVAHIFFLALGPEDLARGQIHAECTEVGIAYRLVATVEDTHGSRSAIEKLRGRNGEFGRGTPITGDRGGADGRT